MTVSITATEVERTDHDPISSGTQIRMGADTFFYFPPEVAAQWLPVLTAIANEKSINA